MNLDRFRLMWLAEGAIGKSHLRWDVYEMFVNDIWPQLTDNEREFIYTYIKRDTAWHWERMTPGDETPHENWLQMLARFNPSNQYRVTMREGRKKFQIADNAYLWNGKYYVGWQRYCAPEYIRKVEHKPYRKCINQWCKSRESCKRWSEYKEGDDVLDSNSYGCEKCDLMLVDDDEPKGTGA